MGILDAQTVLQLLEEKSPREIRAMGRLLDDEAELLLQQAERELDGIADLLDQVTRNADVEQSEDDMEPVDFQKRIYGDGIDLKLPTWTPPDPGRILTILLSGMALLMLVAATLGFITARWIQDPVPESQRIATPGVAGIDSVNEKLVQALVERAVHLQSRNTESDPILARQALADLLQALELAPNHPVALEHIVSVYEALGNLKKAGEYRERLKKAEVEK
ncbi:MAG: hypothetical protein QNK37_03185 [Acidobacteriota bacterium]|nr:hypothetical protein [Acidobacteriota bacterium]